MIFPDSVPKIELSCTPDVAAAAVNLVAIKDKIDYLGKTTAGNSIVSQLFPDWQGYGSIGPYCFADRILPFFRYSRSIVRTNGVRYKALVPTSNVIGQNWRWWPHNLDEAKQQRVVEKAFAAFDASSLDRIELECAEYILIKPLGIVLAHEGKNRVALFKERNIAYIPAMVLEEDYPAAERIRIFKLEGACLAVFDNQFVERVAALNLVRRLLDAYGVEIENSWPAEFAALDQVLADLDGTQYSHSSKLKPIDMNKLKLDEEANDVEVDVTLLDVATVKLPKFRTWLCAAAGLPILFVILQLVSGRWQEIQTIVAMLFGALCMLLTTPLLPLIKTKVRHLDDRQRINEFFEARRRIQQK